MASIGGRVASDSPLRGVNVFGRLGTAAACGGKRGMPVGGVRRAGSAGIFMPACSAGLWATTPPAGVGVLTTTPLAGRAGNGIFGCGPDGVLAGAVPLPGGLASTDGL